MLPTSNMPDALLLDRPGHRAFVGLWIERREMSGHRRRRVIAPLRSVDAFHRLFARIQEAEAEIAHQPLEARACGEIQSGGLHVDRHGARGLHDVRVDEGAIRVREVAHGFQIVLEAVVHRDERDLDQLRLLVDDLLEIFDVDAIVARLHDAEVEALLLAAPADARARRRSAACRSRRCRRIS